MDRFVRRLYSDGDFRAEFLADPAKVIAASGLVGHEREAALRLSGHLAAGASRSKAPSLDGMIWD